MAILDKANIKLNKVVTSSFDGKTLSGLDDIQKRTMEQQEQISKNVKTIQMIRANINPMLCKSPLVYVEDDGSLQNDDQVKLQMLFKNPSKKGGEVVYQSLGFVDFMKILKITIEKKTKLPCYTVIPNQTSYPFYYIEGVERKTVDAKSMWQELFTVYIYIIGESSDDGMKILNDIHELEQSLDDGILLSQEYKLIKQINNGIQMIKIENTNEVHAVIQYDFMISYGYKYKI